MSRDHSEKPLKQSPQEPLGEPLSTEEIESKNVDDSDNTGFIKDWDPISPTLIKDEEERRRAELPSAARSATILIVDDDIDIGEFLRQIIEEETPYQAELVSDGPHALEKAQQLRPCLFLLDYQLPGMNGLQVYDRLQAMESTRGVPVIMMGVSLPTEELAWRGIYQLRKPMDIGNIIRMITHAVATFQEEHLERYKLGG